VLEEVEYLRGGRLKRLVGARGGRAPSPDDPDGEFWHRVLGHFSTEPMDSGRLQCLIGAQAG
jgi:hypothetical protein